MELLIIRHARPIAETRSEGEGSADPPLSPLGVKPVSYTHLTLPTSDLV